MILAAHQPDLLPWTGFWHKAMFADVMDVAIWDQFNRRGYTHRVRMKGEWATLPVEKAPRGTPICSIALRPGAQDVLWDVVRGRYRGDPGWSIWADKVENLILEPATMLWQYNLHLLVGIRELLGVSTPLAIAAPPAGAKVDGLLDLVAQYRATVYLSGHGGHEYMGDDPESRFEKIGCRLLWPAHDPVHGDSILTTLFVTNPEKPLAEVRRTSQ